MRAERVAPAPMDRERAATEDKSRALRRDGDPVEIADLLSLQRRAGNAVVNEVLAHKSEAVQRVLSTDSSWAWGVVGWASGAKELWEEVNPRFKVLLALVTELGTVRDGGAYEPDDVDDWVTTLSMVANKYDRKISLEEGKALKVALSELGLPPDASAWRTTILGDLTASKRVADEEREKERLRLVEEARLAELARLEEVRQAEEARKVKEAEDVRLAEEKRQADEARRLQEAKEKKEADDTRKRKERAEKREGQEKGPTDEEKLRWARQTQGGVIRTELSALMMSVNAKPLDELLAAARDGALEVERAVDTTLLDVTTMSAEALNGLEKRVRDAQRALGAAWRTWGPTVELLATIGSRTRRGKVRTHLKGLTEDQRQAHVGFLSGQAGHIDVAFATLEEAHQAAPDTAVVTATAEMTTLAKYNYDSDLRAEMEASVTREVEHDIASETARLESERDTFLKANPTKTRNEAGSAEARDAIVKARKDKETKTASAIEGMANSKGGRIASGLGAVEDLLAATDFSEQAVTVARWAVGVAGKDPARLRKILETFIRVSGTVSAARFIQLLKARADLDDVNWALDAAANDFQATRTYLTLLDTVDRTNLGRLSKLITDRNGLSQLVLVTFAGLTGAEMHAAVKTLRATLDEKDSVAVLGRLFGRASGLTPAQIAAFLDKLSADHVTLLSQVCAAKGFDVVALKAIVDKDKGANTDILWILGVKRIPVTLTDVDKLLDTKKFVKKQGEDVFKILEEAGADATVDITKDLLDIQTPTQVWSYIDLTKGSHKAPWVLVKLNADNNQTFWTKELCGVPAHSGPAATVAAICGVAVNPAQVGRYAGGNGFGNYGGVDNYGLMNMLLPGGPGHAEVGYREYDLRLHDIPANRGKRRMVVGGGHSFYTGDHYGTFARFA